MQDGLHVTEQKDPNTGRVLYYSKKLVRDGVTVAEWTSQDNSATVPDQILQRVCSTTPLVQVQRVPSTPVTIVTPPSLLSSTPRVVVVGPRMVFVPGIGLVPENLLYGYPGSGLQVRYGF